MFDHDQIRAHIEERFPVGVKFGGAICPTGEHYVELYTGQKASEGSAASSLLGKLNEYCEGKTGVLYWCIIPEVCWFKDVGTWSGFAKLLISDRSAKWEADTDPAYLAAMGTYRQINWRFNLSDPTRRTTPILDDKENVARARKAEEMGIVINWAHDVGRAHG